MQFIGIVACKGAAILRGSDTEVTFATQIRSHLEDVDSVAGGLRGPLALRASCCFCQEQEKQIGAVKHFTVPKIRPVGHGIVRGSRRNDD